jgi:pterin-4a-carbinolamine dehydratase
MIFISYRRQDSSAYARSLRDHLVNAFGSIVFMDVDEIRIGETWPNTLEEALGAATVLIPVIGPTWLRIADDFGRRRLDMPRDWVRTEIERSILRGSLVLPVLVGGALMPPAEALPESISDLPNRQQTELREAHWQRDLVPLVQRLAALDLKQAEEPLPVPQWKEGTRPKIIHRALSSEEVDQALKVLGQWNVVISPLPGEYPKTRQELHRVFRFASFGEAIQFCRKAVPHIDQANHHPRWENIFKTVTVWLSTWDVGHAVTQLDVELATYLEWLYVKMKG